MNTDRIQEIQSKTAYPESRSVAQALLQVWNEVAQECEAKPKMLAKKHTAMRVDHSGLLGRIAGGCKVRPDQRYMLGELNKHLVEMAEQFYSGNVSIVDEFLQLYCLDEKRPGHNGRTE